MSSFVSHTPEGEPFFQFSSNVGPLLATPDNSAVFRHPFEHRGIDHIFVEMGREDDDVRGAFLFRGELEMIKPGMFERILEELTENDWQFIECDQVADSDRAVFERFADNQMVKVTNKAIKKWLKEPEKPTGQYL